MRRMIDEMISFACPRCGQTINIDENHAGKRGVCKTCGAELRVPMMSSPSPKPVSVMDAPQKRNSPKLWFILLVIFIVLGCTCFWLIRGSSGPASLNWSPITPTASPEVSVQYDRFQDTTTASLGGIGDKQWRLLVANGDGTYKSVSDTINDGYYVSFKLFYKGNAIQSPPARDLPSTGRR
jgi:DNA-directed RNA polymerase subunit RPC12/RpoP